MAMASSPASSIFGGWPFHSINSGASGGSNGLMSSPIQQYHQNRKPPSLFRRRGQLRRPSEEKNERIISVSEAIRRMELDQEEVVEDDFLTAASATSASSGGRPSISGAASSRYHKVR